MGSLVADYVAAVPICWMFAFLSVLSFGGTDVTAQETADARAFVNAAAIIAIVTSVAVVIIAVRKQPHRLSTPSKIAIAVAVLSPWVLLIVAIGGRVSGE